MNQIDELPIDRLLKANEACNRFESAIRAGQPARVDDFLNGICDPDRVTVRAELEAIAQACGSDPMPRAIGEYDVLGLLGQGGMGRVYRARHRTMKRDVALKMLTAQEGGSDQRFQREIEILAGLKHPHLVAAFDAGRSGPWRFLVTELIDGIDLARQVKEKGPLSPERVIHVLRQTCAGLEYMHGQGIIHRDVKPSNLMLDAQGNVRILDVGLARAADRAGSSLTRLGLVMGTVDFMAPEQAAAAHQADARSDLYSLGCSAFFLLTGRPPFPEASLMDVLIAHRERPAPALGPEVPEDLARLIADLLAKKPEQRPPSAREVLRRLGVDRVRNNTSDAGSTMRVGFDPRVKDRLASFGSRPRLTMIGAVVVLAAVAAGLIWFNWPPSEPRPAPRDGVSRAAYPLSDAKAYQEAWAHKLGVPVTVTGPAEIKLVFIPPGEFVMGTPEPERRELRDKHGIGGNLERIEAEKEQPVKIKQPFYLGATEVTIGQFKEYVDATGIKTHAEEHRGYGRIKDANSARWELKAGYCWHTFGDHVFANDLPVFNLTWKEAVDFTNWLTLQDNGQAHYRLPTEAEWEYACRAGSVTPWSGATEKTLHQVAWHGWRADQQLKPVAGKLPNAFGLYDMHGNHSEWCGLAVGPLSHFPPLPPQAQDQRPVRGGSFHHPAERLRSAARAWFPPDEMGIGGFRVLKEIR